MPKTILHLVRHAQGYHNLNTENHALRDPLLTPHGRSQCETLSSVFPYHAQITDIVASPLRRTIYTALLSFPEEVSSRGIPVVALPEVQETSDLPCDTGSDPEVLKNEFGMGEWDGKVELGLVKEGWNDKTASSKWAPVATKIDARAREARVFLRELGRKRAKELVRQGVVADEKDAEPHIVVVTHGGFLHYFTEDWEGHDGFLGTGWQNTEFRSYNFVVQDGDGEEDKGASLVETAESRKRRNGKEIPLTREEQINLRRVAEKQWSDFGFQTPKETLTPENEKQE
ncbi:phosphoglycerate mutase family protein-like protein [Xylogone sp. PMI_703]|nr:phosphoglycerate mutase family protein-like protein [Xylogone sp. PMI_703]